ncbi:hypothetical protein [Streptomyces sp. NPDC059247]|uniref:hypothetical protein n=1 Tax=Streptomyces sp. NPDC059247 TaxID=3346790 RepID=UPI00367A64E7
MSGHRARAGGALVPGVGFRWGGGRGGGSYGRPVEVLAVSGSLAALQRRGPPDAPRRTAPPAVPPLSVPRVGQMSTEAYAGFRDPGRDARDLLRRAAEARFEAPAPGTAIASA